MRKYSKTFDASKIKTHFSYSTINITEKLGVTKGTVYAWVEEGLKPIDDLRPHLFHGSELRRFIKNRQEDRKHKCEVNEMFCLKCQRPRRALKSKTSLQTTKGRKPNLTGFCITCNTQMNKSISLRNLEEILKIFDLEKAYESHLIESGATATNHNKKTGE